MGRRKTSRIMTGSSGLNAEERQYLESYLACRPLCLDSGVTNDENKFDTKCLFWTEPHAVPCPCSSTIRKLTINLNTIFQIMTQTTASFQQLGIVPSCVSLAPRNDLEVFVSTLKHKKKRTHFPLAVAVMKNYSDCPLFAIFRWRWPSNEWLHWGQRQETIDTFNMPAFDGQMWILWIQITETCPLFF